MKKTIIILSMFLAVTSCSKEEDLPEPTQTAQASCKCGKIISDDVSDYSIRVRNNCSQNVKKFILEQGDWMTAYVGTDICFNQNW